jgi:hypothetical protein
MSSDNWNVKESLNWGFYFFDIQKNKLEKIIPILMKKGFKLNGLDKLDGRNWKLWISKKEVLTPEKLHQRNLEFNELVDYYSVVLYDGWDVEK